MKNKLSSKQNRLFKIMELNKTPERKKFESEYSCYIFSLRPPSMFTPEDKEVSWVIDSWYKVKNKDYINTSNTYKLILMRAMFNNASVYGIWLSNEFNDSGSDQINNPDLFYDLIWKYKFKL